MPHYVNAVIRMDVPSAASQQLLALACVLLQRQTPFDPHFGQAAAPVLVQIGCRPQQASKWGRFTRPQAPHSRQRAYFDL